MQKAIKKYTTKLNILTIVNIKKKWFDEQSWIYTYFNLYIGSTGTFMAIPSTR